MPIYAYRCDACGHAKDVLQKMSDPVLTTCPGCGAQAFKKQVTAAGFQLKGSGWYVTDFRGGASGAPAEKTTDGEAQPAAKPAATSGDSKSAHGAASQANAAPGTAAASGAGPASATAPSTAAASAPALAPPKTPETPKAA